MLMEEIEIEEQIEKKKRKEKEKDKSHELSWVVCYVLGITRNRREGKELSLAKRRIGECLTQTVSSLPRSARVSGSGRNLYDARQGESSLWDPLTNDRLLFDGA
jgi:hypothetical protein